MNAPFLYPNKPLPITSKNRAHSFQKERLSHAEIIKKLKVLSNPRYKAEAGLTYCNIAAHDFATLYGVYIPRVWWTDQALREKDWRVIYGTTVRELNANSLVQWMKQYGAEFGWTRSTITEAQEHVNAGGFATIIADRKDRSRSGHITVIIPGEIKDFGPNQWQAGAQNSESSHSKWYQSPQYLSWNVWICRR